MLDPIALLQSLTLPAGALTGQRIVLDGVSGLIQIYNSSNQLVGQIDAAGVFTSFDPVNGSTAQLTSDASTGVGAAGIILSPPPVASHTVNKTKIFVYDDGAGAGHREHVQFVSPGIDALGGVVLDMAGKDLNGAGPGAIFADGTGSLPGTAQVEVQGTLNALVDLKAKGHSVERVVAKTEFGNGSIGGVTTTETDIFSFSFTADSARSYRYVFQGGQGMASTVANDGANVWLTDNSNNHIDNIGISLPIANRAFPFTFITEENGLSGTINRKLRFVRFAGTGTLTYFFGGASSGHAFLYVEEVA